MAWCYREACVRTSKTTQTVTARLPEQYDNEFSIQRTCQCLRSVAEISHDLSVNASRRPGSCPLATQLLRHGCTVTERLRDVPSLAITLSTATEIIPPPDIIPSDISPQTKHFRRNRFSATAQAISHLATHYFVALSVCLSSVFCHICALCLNRSTDFHAIWQLHLQGPMAHCVRWGPWSPGKGEMLRVEPFSPFSQNMQ